jgi:hypothetical protein
MNAVNRLLKCLVGIEAIGDGKLSFGETFDITCRAGDLYSACNLNVLCSIFRWCTTGYS